MLNENLVEIKGDPFIIEMMYARKENMTGRAVYEEIGFGNRAYVHKDMATCLEKLIPWLQQHRRKLKICDAYRPPLAHRLLKEVIPMPGFFASSPERSQHCHGTAVDVVLTDMLGHELPYPTKVDAYDEEMAREVQYGISENFMEHLKKARQDFEYMPLAMECANRDELRRLMQSVGLHPIGSEWWHYDLTETICDQYPMIEWEK